MDISVVYLIAKGRSGSNLLAHCLGQLDDFVNTGELYHLWHWGLQGRALCGCGSPVPECPLWSRVVDIPELRSQSWPEISQCQDRIFSWPWGFGLAVAPWVLFQSSKVLRRYSLIRSQLYRSIVGVSGAEVVVDASKWPWDPVVLGLVPGVRVAVVHLVRDPRAVAHSWQRHKSWGDHDEQPTPMPRYRASYSAMSWTARNMMTEWVKRKRTWPWMQVRYEDFVRSPSLVLEQITDLVGHPRVASMVDGNKATLRSTHSVAGNASKFQKGQIEIRSDDAWEQRSSLATKLTGTMLAAPLLRRYGYPIWPGES